jgi:hypothetical protein
VIPPTPSNPLTLTSIGNSHNASITVVATVGFPTFADYMFLTNCDIDIGAEALISGQVRSNGDISNLGEVTGLAQAAGRVSGSGTFDQGYLSGQAAIDFTKVLVDMANIKSVATASGTAYGPSGRGYYGYAVTLNGTQATVAKVTGGTSTGNLTTTGAGTVNIPSSDVLYFGDNVYVQGTYSTAVSIVSSSTIYVVGNYLRANSGGTYTSGLIAQNNVYVPTDWSSLPTNLTISAAMLAQSGTCEASPMTSGNTKQSLTINGSLAYYTVGGYAQSSYGGVTAGFQDRTYNYDMRFQFYPPPMFPDSGSTGALKVNSWVEAKPVG